MIANKACQSLRKKVSPPFAGRDFGADIGEFVVVAVAVSEEDATNRRFYELNTKNTYSKDLLTGVKTKVISVGVPIPMLLFNAPNEAEIERWIVTGLKSRLDAIKFPKKFDKDAFVSELLAACERAISIE